MDKFTQILDKILLVGGPYLPSIGVFMLVYFLVGLAEDLLQIRGIWKWLVAILVAVLFFHFWDDVTLKFEGILRMMGMTPATPGKFN